MNPFLPLELTTSTIDHVLAEANMSEATWAFLIVQVIGFLTLALKGLWDSQRAKLEARRAEANRIQDRLDREQDRLDREQLATLTMEQLAATREAGSERLKTLVGEIQQVKQVAITGIKASKAAIDTANGVNAKIASLGKQILSEQQRDSAPTVPSPDNVQ